MNELETKKRQLQELNACDVNNILDNAAKIIGNPLVMIDTSYNLLGYTKNVITDDPIWNELIKYNKFTHKTVNFFNEEKFIYEFAKSEIVTLMKTDKLKYDRINGKLFNSNNIQVGSITVIACYKPFNKDDFELIEVMCEIISAKLQNSEIYNKIDIVYKESFLNDLISKNSVKKTAKLKKEIGSLYNELNDNLYVMVVDISMFDKTITHLAYFRDVFKELQPEYKYFIHLNNVIAIIGIKNETLTVNRHLNKLNQFFKENNINAGISSKFDNLFKIKKSYYEALNAINYGLKGCRKTEIYFYDDFRAEYFLNSVKEFINITEFFHPSVCLIREYDRVNNTNFFNLIATYLSCGLNSKTTAEVLQLKEIDLVAELNIVKQLFNIDFTNGDTLFNLYATIKAID